MKLYLASCNDGYRQFTLIIVAKDDNAAFKEANKVAMELFSTKFNFSIREVSNIENYKVVLVDENELKDKEKPWKPKWGEKFYSIYWYFDTDDNKWNIEVACNILSPHNIEATMYADIGNCFKTKKEAESNKFAIYKQLTGKEW